MKTQRYMDLSTFVCQECGNRFPLMRNHGKQRERGHIKDLWCPFCRTDRKFIEVRTGDYYVCDNGKVIYS